MSSSKYLLYNYHQSFTVSSKCILKKLGEGRISIWYSDLIIQRGSRIIITNNQGSRMIKDHIGSRITEDQGSRIKEDQGSQSIKNLRGSIIIDYQGSHIIKDPRGSRITKDLRPQRI